MDTREDRPIRGEVRMSGYRRVSHGLYVAVRSNLTPDEEFRRDLRALRLVLPEDAVFTHVTAARLLGWHLPALPEQVPFFAAVRGDRSPRRPGVLCSRLTHDSTPTVVDGFPVDAPEEVLLRCARDLSVLDLVIMIDSALHQRGLSGPRMQEILASSRPGVVRLRKAWVLADQKCESPGETVLRLFHAAMDVPTESQVELYNDAGAFMGRGDLLVRGTTRIHEYDGAGHRTGASHRADLRRERGLVGSRYQRSGFTLDDLLNHAVVVMHELDRLLKRPHKPSRLARWRDAVDESLYSETGRQRVLNRWRRAIGAPDWRESARRAG